MLRSCGGPPHFVVLTAGTCIPGIAVSKVSRAAHYLSICRSRLSLLRPPLPCCLETKSEREWGQRREEEGGPYQRRMKEERSEGRTGRQGSDEVCLGYFGFLRPLCGGNILSLFPGPQLKEHCFFAGAGIHFSTHEKAMHGADDFQFIFVPKR